MSRVFGILENVEAGKKHAITESDLARLLKYVKVDEKTGCWIWQGAKLPRGYGRLGVGGRAGWMDYAHRIMWVIANGTLPRGMEVMHQCPHGDNTSCCNPDHLTIGSHDEHVADRFRKMQIRLSRKGLPFGAKLTKSGTYHSSIRKHGKYVFLGAFKTAEEASAVALAERAKDPRIAS